MITPLVGIAVYFWGYDLGKKMVRRVEGIPPDQKLGFWGTMFAAGFSAIPGTLVIAPGDRVKVTLQVQGQTVGPPKYGGFYNSLRKILREDGIRGLYKGTLLTLFRDIPGAVAYYESYEVMKTALTPTGSATGPLTIVFCGGIAGVMNWLVALPPDVIKSRFQAAPAGTYPGGIAQVFRELIHNEGIGSLYKGLGPALLRAFPGNAACFLGMESSKKFLNYLF